MDAHVDARVDARPDHRIAYNMIRWHIQSVLDHPWLAAGRPPQGLLTVAETARYASYISPQRRRDWLLGRWTAKQLIQLHVAATCGFSPALASFSIEQEPSGVPFAASLDPTLYGSGKHGRLPVSLSISHSRGYAFCALSDDPMAHVRVGADIEVVEPQPADFGDKFFTPAEQANIQAAPVNNRVLLTIATWSVKEAVLKASTLGMRATPQSVECKIRTGRPRHWTPLTVTLQPTTRQASGAVGPLRAWWRVIDNRLLPGTSLVLTLAAFGATL